MRAGILGFVIIFTSICIALFIIAGESPVRPPAFDRKSTLPAQVKSYTNSSNRFSFSYSKDLQISESSDKKIVSISHNDRSLFVLQVVASGSAVGRKTPLQYILDICKGSTITTKCSVDSQSVITSSSGTTGSSYYLRKTQMVLKNTVGPFVFFPLPSDFPYQSGFIILYPKELTLAAEDRENFMTIINTFTLFQAQPLTPSIGSSSAK